jgi:hypothetical protein
MLSGVHSTLTEGARELTMRAVVDAHRKHNAWTVARSPSERLVEARRRLGEQPAVEIGAHAANESATVDANLRLIEGALTKPSWRVDDVARAEDESPRCPTKPTGALAVKSGGGGSHRPLQIGSREFHGWSVQSPSRGAAAPPTSPQIKPPQLHHLDPRGGEVPDELLAGVIRRVDLGDGAQLGV